MRARQHGLADGIGAGGARPQVEGEAAWNSGYDKGIANRVRYLCTPEAR
jgi:hypothetical protein